MNNTDTYKIFNESNCLSREILQAYNKNALTDAQKLEAEQHLVDCEMCSDALEGFALMTGTNSLNETIESVKALSEKKQIPVKELTLKNTLLAAASVAALLLFGAIAFSLFQNNLKDTQVAQQVSLPNEQEKTKAENSREPAIPEMPPQVTEKKEEIRAEAPIASKSAETVTDASEALSVREKSLALDENKVAPEETDNKAVQLATSATENVVSKDAPAEITSAAGATIQQNKPVLAKVQSTLPTNRANNSNNNYDFAAQADSKEDRKLALRNAGVIYVEGVRVYDYTPEYETNFKKKDIDNGIAAKYPDLDTRKQEKAAAEKEIVVLSYADALKSGLKNFNRKEYANAQSMFETILAKHPDNVNAIFYKALCLEETGNYNLALAQLSKLDAQDNKTFDEESLWHRAVILQKKGNTFEAKKLFEEIAATDGFYSKQAKEKLENLK